MKVKLTNVRAAFMNVFEPKSVDGSGDARYSVAFILDPKGPYIAEIKEAIKTVAAEKWKDKAGAVLNKLVEEKRIAYKAGPLTDKSGDVYDGFEGMHSLNASSKKRPVVADTDGSPLTAADGKPYSGCYVDASVEFWAQDNQWGRRVNATLRWVQFRRDGDAFAGGATPVSSDEIADISSGTDADPMGDDVPF